MIPVLYYHRVGHFSPGEERRMNVEPARFREQMKRLGERQRPVTLDAVIGGAPSGAVAVTFDDGYRDLMEHALPVLKEFRIPAAFFVVVDSIGGKDRWYRGDRDILTWDDLKRLADAGMEIGSHSMTHRRMDQVDAVTQERELVDSKRVLEEKLARPVKHFAYPQGGHTAEVKRAVEKAGYAAGWATKGGDGGRYSMKRLPVSANVGMFRFGWKLRKARWGWY